MKFLKLEEIRFSNKTAFLLVLIAYVFSMAVRLYYYNWASHIKEFLWHSTLMINNPDGYWYAQGAKELLNNSHVVGDMAPIHSLPSILTAAIVKLFPFLSLDEVILWMSAVFGSLIVIPLFLIGRSLKNDVLGFVAALLGSIAWSYYNRTLVGYYDTDMLVITFLLFVVWGIIEWFENKNEKMLFVVPLVIVLYEWWYPSCRSVTLGVVFFAFLYALFKKETKNFIFLGIVFLTLSRFEFYINFVMFLAVYALYRYRPFVFEGRKIWMFLGAVFVVLAVSGSFDAVISKFFTYLKINQDTENTLHFYNVYKTISEASQIPYSLVAKRISGGVGIFIFSAIGYILMLVRYPVMVVSIPSVIVGLLAHKLGLRFTIYAVPFFALGFSYLALIIARDVSQMLKQYKKVAFYGVIAVLSVYALYKNIDHVIKYKVPSVFLNEEVASLDKLSKIAKREDYAYTWWDYGYPIRYYAGIKTVIDGGKHSGEDNYPVSFSLTRNGVAAANMARLYVEYTDKKAVAKELGKEFKTEGFLNDMMKKYGYKDINKFLNALNSPDFKLPEKTRDIYFYLPFRMFNIYPTIATFSYIDLKTGKENMPLIISTAVSSSSPKGIIFSNGMVLLPNGVLKIGKQGLAVSTLYIGTYLKDGRYRVFHQTFNPRAGIAILWYQPLNKVLIVDKRILNSTFIQMFFFEKYDKNLFEPVIVNPFVKIYRLKR